MNTTKTDLKAKDIMTHDPVSVDPSTSIRALARILEENEISGATVVDSQGTLVGIVSKSDLIRRCSEGAVDVPPAYLFEILSEQSDEEPSAIMPEPLVCVQDFMTEDPVTVLPNEPIARIARLMSDRHIHRVVVVDNDNYPLGIITSMDLLAAFPQG